ncbi:MAG: DUF1992 domain-containing protein [Candidatus Limnocylindrales bacterium]
MGETRETYIERMIREATERGEFDDLPHHGRPLPRPTGPGAGEWELAFSMLRNAGMAPPWIEADKECRRIRAERDALLERAQHASAASHGWYRGRLRELITAHARATDSLNASAPSERLQRRPLRMEREMEALDRILGSDESPRL